MTDTASLYIGVMSGTSVDGIDVALIDFSQPKPQLVHALCVPWEDSLKSSIQQFIEQPSNITLDAYGTLNTALGHAYADAINTLLLKSNTNKEKVIAIGNHGQTLRHQPNADTPFSLQMGDAAVIAEHTGITTIDNFRARDIAAGGQGAPLVPAFHQAFFANSEEHRVIANIGGIANITVLPAQSDSIKGFDTGPGNTLMDAFCQHHTQKSFDENGNIAATGSVNTTLLNNMLSHPYFEQPAPKSTGREVFNMDWLTHHLNRINTSLSEHDILATLCELTAHTLCQHIKTYAPECQRLLICGGGVQNSHLMHRITSKLNCPVESTEQYGLHPDWVEATAFAWLAKQCLDKAHGNIPAITGASSNKILGAVYWA